MAGGASAAVRARRLSESADIIMLERGPYVSFANCGLPYHIGGDIPEHSALVLKTPADFADRFNIDVRVRHEVLSIDTAICHPEDIISLDPATQCLLDIRGAQERRLHGEYPNALHIPLDTLRQRLQELPADKEILIGCQSGLRGHAAYRLLIQRGFRARNLSGGFITYRTSVAQ
ncbi:rhodanese-like domain-containing protein [Dickeya dianthicola]|uniref:rhodanese-like domain-containing protein n=1 Tax=Dickeya dianthicola TaxID=204039 RepID=UPI0003A74C91|nr:NADH dehydrogenase [Dickeya dianthicola RNS04.9]